MKLVSALKELREAQDYSEFAKQISLAVDFINDHSNGIEKMPAFLFELVQQVFSDVAYLTSMKMFSL